MRKPRAGGGGVETPPTPPLYFIFYQSELTRKAALAWEETKNNITKVAQTENNFHEITGRICYISYGLGAIVVCQYLEGRRDQVKQLYTNIKRDDRVKRIEIISQGPCFRRFPGEPMTTVEGRFWEDIVKEYLDILPFDVC